MKKLKPLIGIVPLVDAGRESYWLLPGYMQGVTQAGGLPVMLSLTEEKGDLAQLADVCDGFLFTGGQDVSPEMYGEQVTSVCGETCPDRDGMERLLLEVALERNRAVLGICRGIQFLNAALGGTLYQDLPTQVPSQVCHRQPAPYDQPAHTVHLPVDAPLGQLLGREELGVNSCHHQGIRTLAPGLCSMAQAPDGLTEAVWLPDRRFVWAVQWHPEFSWKVDEASRRIFAAFVEGARGN